MKGLNSMSGKLILVIMCCLSCLQGKSALVNAEITKEVNIPEQENTYRPLFVDGKEWVVVHGWILYGWDINRTKYDVHQVLRISVAGDEVIDGINCKKLRVRSEYNSMTPESMTGFEGFICCTKVPSDEVFYYVYEKDRKIYVYRNPGPYYDEPAAEDDLMFGPVVKYGEPYFDLYMDLNHSVGEKMTCCTPESLFYNQVEIVEDEYQEHGEMSCRTLTFSDGGHWIEGIGSDMLFSMYDPYATGLIDIPVSYSGMFNYLVSCTQDNKVLYDNRDWCNQKGMYFDDFLSGIKSVGGDYAVIDASYYNMFGLKVDNPKKGGIYIHQGKKIIY